MIPELIGFNYLITEEWKPCDALQVWIDRAKELDIKQREIGLNVWFNARKGINIGDTYLQYEFVDKESGELLVLSVLPEMNKLMVSNNFYPKIIQNAFDKFKNV